MAATVLTLDELSDSQLFTYFFGSVGFTVNSDTDEDVIAFEKVVGNSVLLQINNTGSNGLIYTLYGLNQDVSAPLAFTSTDWKELPSGIVTVSSSSTDAQTISDNWFWILLRVKRETTLLDTTLDFTIRTA